MPEPDKNPAAQNLGRLGGEARAAALSPARRSAIARKGGKARAKSLTPERRSDIARRARRVQIDGQ